MQKLFLMLLVLIILSNHSQAESENNFTPNEATVYYTGLMLYGNNTVKLKKGMNKITIKNIDRYSIQNRVLVSINTRFARVISMNSIPFSNSESTYLKNKDYKRIKDSLDLTNKQITLNNNAYNNLNQEKNMLNANQRIGGTQNGVDPVKLEQMAVFYRKRMTDISEKMFELTEMNIKNKEIKQSLRLRKTIVRNRIYRLGNKLMLTVMSDKALSASINTGIYLNNGGWSPSYNIRFENVKKDLGFELVGNIRNQTGYDWNNIKLKLSTAQPNQNLTLPGLRRWIVDFVKQIRIQSNGKKERAYRMNNTANRGNYIEKIEAENTSAPRNAGKPYRYSHTKVSEVQQTYVLPYRTFVGKNTSNNKMILESKTVKANYKHVSIPKLQPDGYLQAQIGSWEQLNLLTANANVYNDGVLLGNTYINTQTIKDTLKIYMGRDRRMVVKRSYRHVKTETNLLGKTKRYYEYTITLRNTHSGNVNLFLIDQIPISKHDDITVEVKENAGGSYRKQDGTMRWNLELGAGDSKVLKVRFVIKHPKNKNIQLNTDYRKPMISY